LFIDSSLPQQLLGHGLGHERRFAFHSDYMRLLISLGIVGLFLYLILLFYLLWDIFLCRDKKTKYLFGAILISVAIMNFGSNAVVFRFELSQYFWLIMGLFYMIENSEIENNA
jgi:O-antigen ligase